MDFYQMKKTNTLWRMVSWIVDAVVVISLAWFVVYRFGTQIQVVGQSMAPGLPPDSVVLVNRLVYDYGNPERFDVAVFERDDKESNVKRVIGLPGEMVQIKGSSIYINSELLETEEDLGHVSLAGLAENPVRPEEDEYFLLGDNRDSSEGSRFANIGNVNRAQISGEVWMRILPIVDIGLVH